MLSSLLLLPVYLLLCIMINILNHSPPHIHNYKHTMCSTTQKTTETKLKNELQSSSGIIIDGVRGLLMFNSFPVKSHNNSSKPQMHQTIHRSHGNMPCSPPHGRLRGNNQCCKSNPNTISRQRQPNSPINLLQLQRQWIICCQVTIATGSPSFMIGRSELVMWFVIFIEKIQRAASQTKNWIVLFQY